MSGGQAGRVSGGEVVSKAPGAPDGAAQAQDKGCCSDDTVRNILGIFSLAILCVGIGALNGSYEGLDITAMGWTVAGIGGAAVLVAACGNEKIKKIIYVTIMAIFALIGILAGAGVLNTAQFGWALVISQIAIVGLSCCCGSVSLLLAAHVQSKQQRSLATQTTIGAHTSDSG